VVGLSVYQTYMKDLGREEERLIAGKLLSLTNGCHASSENKTVGNWDMSGSEINATMTTDVELRKLSQVVSDSVAGHRRRSEKLSTTAVGDKLNSVVTKVAKKNSTKRKCDKVDKPSGALLDTMPAQNKTVNSRRTEKSSDMSSTGKVFRKVGRVPRQGTVAASQGSSVNSTFDVTSESRRKTTSSHVIVKQEIPPPCTSAGGMTLRPRARRNAKASGSAMSKRACRSEVATVDEVADEVQETFVNQETPLPCTSTGGITLRSSTRRNAKASGSAVSIQACRSEVAAVDEVAHEVQETFVKQETPLPCTSTGGITLRSSTRRNAPAGGSTVYKQASSSDSSQVKTAVAETVAETYCENKYTDVGVVCRRRRPTNKLAIGDAACKQANSTVCSSAVETGEERVTVCEVQSPSSITDETIMLSETDSVILLEDDDNHVVEINNSIDKTLQETCEKQEGAAICEKAGTAYDSAVKSDVTENMNITLKECDMNIDNARLRPCETGAAARVCQKASSVSRTKESSDNKGSSSSFHMTLRGRQAQLQLGLKSQKRRSVTSEDKENATRKPCLNNDQKHRLVSLKMCWNS